MLSLLMIIMALAATAQGMVCGDSHPNCALSGYTGFCHDAGFRNLCPFTCGICTCKDAWKKGTCVKANEEGKCSSDHATMIHCRDTCGICACMDKTSAVGCRNFLAYGQCVVNPVANFECPATCKLCGDCQDSLMNCQERADAGDCFHTDMLHGCKKTCGFCGHVCQDAAGLDLFCASIKENNQCEAQKLQAYTLCAKTCGFCGGEEEEPTVVP